LLNPGFFFFCIRGFTACGRRRSVPGAGAELEVTPSIDEGEALIFGGEELSV